MTVTDYLLNGALVALVVLQIRGRRMTTRMLLLPVVAVGIVAVDFLHSVPTAGNDLVLIMAGALCGLVLGTACGLATRVFRRTDGIPIAKAGAIAALLWVVGVGARVAFALYATHGGGDAIGRFGIAHQITSPEAWATCLVLMAIAEVVSRTAVLAAKQHRLPDGCPTSPHLAAGHMAGRAMMDLGDQRY